MTRLLSLFVLFCGVAVGTNPVLAQPGGAIQAYYEAYAAGVNVIDVEAAFTVDADRYEIRLDYRTVGAFGLLLSSRQHTVVEGRFVGMRAAPVRFYSSGVLRGVPRVTQIEYRDGQPVVRQLQPATEMEREQVSAADQANTVDTLSAMAELIRRINTSGRCEGRLATFDGRRLSELEARAGGEQELERTGRSSFAGRALRCDFVGRQLGGFMLDEDRERLRRPQTGTAWFASVTAGGPKIPVRIAFRTRWFGEATMYLANKPAP